MRHFSSPASTGRTQLFCVLIVFVAFETDAIAEIVSDARMLLRAHLTTPTTFIDNSFRPCNSSTLGGVVRNHRVYREVLRDTKHATSTTESAGMSTTTTIEISPAFITPSAAVKAQS